ncbi:hypothetical protein [Brevundimonas sp. Root1423]|uniref:hypothetical protein n=1 Tax=Brevundimonas sp. Root1423 TaxID=1736462 RepID=UPI0006FB5941|nr:hypothetical protein [Brevundimonas sp. Root1423]KQY89699.1 hypothetical protein ASD25_03885 [Brevundimonas sp. Root1423]
MNRKRPWRLAAIVLIALVLTALAVRAVVRFADANASYTDDAVDIEVIAPPSPPPVPATN